MNDKKISAVNKNNGEILDAAFEDVPSELLLKNCGFRILDFTKK